MAYVESVTKRGTTVHFLGRNVHSSSSCWDHMYTSPIAFNSFVVLFYIGGDFGSNETKEMGIINVHLILK